MYHCRENQNNLRKDYQNNYADNASQQEKACALENRPKAYFRGQGLYHEYIDTNWRGDCSHCSYHRQDYGVPHRIKTKSRPQGKEDRDGQDKKPQGIYKASPYQIDQQHDCQNKDG